MSNITAGDEGSYFSSGNTVGEDVQLKQQAQVNNQFHGSNYLLSTNNNGSSTPQQQSPPPPPPPAKKKRNLPGNPDPNAEVTALSPKTLLATNRFICEICNKGFQREQNLQLHRRGHNLPWKLKQRSSTGIRKKVYICPEASCVHHNPSRALGDLTGIKKHFCRKHGEKKWKCDKCSKKYAVQSDWKAHSKTCGTKEYKCYCGTIFSRRDSFITHRAFCDALTEENNKTSQGLVGNVGSNLQCQVTDQLIPVTPIDNNPITLAMNVSDPFSNDTKSQLLLPLTMAGTMFSTTCSAGNLFGGSKSVPNSSSSCLQLNANSSTLFERNGHLFSGSASMSATALLQKAAQMGATASTGYLNSSLMGKSSNTSMAPPFVSMQTQNYQSQMLGDDAGFANEFLQKGKQEIHSEVFKGNGGRVVQNSSMPVNNMGMFSRVFDQNNALLKSASSRATGLSGLNDDMTTVDFLGISGSTPRNLLEKRQDLDQFGGIDQATLQSLSLFQQHAALEKSMWKV